MPRRRKTAPNNDVSLLKYEGFMKFADTAHCLSKLNELNTSKFAERSRHLMIFCLVS